MHPSDFPIASSCFEQKIFMFIQIIPPWTHYATMFDGEIVKFLFAAITHIITKWRPLDIAKLTRITWWIHGFFMVDNHKFHGFLMVDNHKFHGFLMVDNHKFHGFLTYRPMIFPKKPQLCSLGTAQCWDAAVVLSGSPPPRPVVITGTYQDLP